MKTLKNLLKTETLNVEELMFIKGTGSNAETCGSLACSGNACTNTACTQTGCHSQTCGGSACGGVACTDSQCLSGAKSSSISILS